MIGYDVEDRDQAIDALSEIEPDCYTSDLTSWLNSNSRNVYYLTEALEEMEIRDGFQALSYAQSRYIDEIGYAIIDGIDELIGE